MKGDFTRSTFKPAKGYSSVRMQQGRVQLDADWNEQIDIGDRLREQGFSDIIGRCGAPKDEHGGGFKVENDGGDLTVTPGRIWVNGILCEATAPEGESVLPLTAQEDFPAYQDPDQSSRYLIYLDVWEQHVTALEDEEIRETALGGPDTTTRTRTVAQVKWVRVPDGSECEDELAAWDRVTAAPTGRMRARTRPGDEGGPCVVPESAGYTRLENQLYRVEVHRGGELGGAGPQPTFKWSRENGTVVTSWLDTNGQQVTVKSLGRDELLGFAQNDWVEVGDDRDELNGEHGQLLRIAGQPIDNTLPLSAAPGAPGPADRHPKVRRWDMRGAGGALPIVQAPNDDDDSWTALESGIQVDFAPGTYRTGDWWWIPARAFIGEFTGDIEWPEEAGAPASLSPAGVQHHYCRLALADFAGGSWVGTPEDCRPVFCPLTELESGEGCCTVVVEPGTDLIQAAIDSLPAAGGCVCLKAGIHTLTETVIIGRSNVTLHGESAGTVVRSAEALPLLRTGTPGPYLEGIEIAGIDFLLEVPPQDADSLALLPLVDLESTDGAQLIGCRAAVSEPSGAVGLRIGRGIDLRIEDCRVENVFVGIWLDTDSTHVAIRRCGLSMPPDDQEDRGWIGILIEDAYGPCIIEDNRIEGYVLAVRLDKAPVSEAPQHTGGGSIIAGNRIRRSSELGDLGIKAFAIDVAGSGCVVRDNRIGCPSPRHGGIRLTGRRGRLENNLLWGPQESSGGDLAAFALAVLVGYEGTPDEGFGEGAVVVGNRLEGAFDGIWIHGADDVEVRDNRLFSDAQALRAGIVLFSAAGATVTGNRLEQCTFGLTTYGGSGNRLEQNRLQTGWTGVVALDEDTLWVAGNEVADQAGPGFAGILLSGQTTLQGNRFTACSYQPSGLPAVGVAALCDDPAGQVHFQNCEVLDTGISPNGEVVLSQAVGGVVLWAMTCTVQDNRIQYTNSQQLGLAFDHRALVLLGAPIYTTNDLVIGFGRALVEGNSFVGPAPQALVSVLRLPVSEQLSFGFNWVTFSDNQCLHLANPAAGGPTVGDTILQSDSVTVHLAASRSTVQSNQVASFPVAASFDFEHLGRTVLLGNFLQGPVIRWNPFPLNFGELNQFN
ncbi:MAG: DUF6519 domain-containing protein [Acidobacteriota bacterium]|nr:DUF6519 domain-containing protein [Acidobacteriota bacterium]